MTRYWEKLLHYTYTGLLSWEVSNYLVSRLKKKKSGTNMVMLKCLLSQGR